MKKTIKKRNTRTNRRNAINKNAKRKNRCIIILTTMIHTATAVLDMPDTYGDRCIRAREVIIACTGNAYVTVTTTVIDATQKLLDDYIAAKTAAERNALYSPLKYALQSIMSLFQNAANAAADNAVVIIESGSFKVKHITMQQKHEFEAANSVVSGKVHLPAPGGGEHTCHDWHYAADGITYVRMMPTVAAETDKDGLTPGAYAWFMHQLITKEGPQGLSQPVKILVK